MASIDKYVDLIKLLENIFGKGSVSRSIGTRTNVVRFPKGKQGLDPTKREFDVERTAIENPDLIQTIENVIEDRMGDITKMNDQELLTYTANVRRLNNVKNPPKLPDADVIKFGSGEEIKGKGLEELIEKQGTKFSPTTDIGRLEASSKRLEKAGEDLKKTIDEQKPQSIVQAAIDDFLGTEKILDDFNRTGYVRATVRQIMREDIQAGKLKLPKELEDQIMQGLGEPIDIWRRVYGEGALEQIDSIADDLSKLRTEEQAAQMARSKFTFEPDVNRPPGSYTPEQDPSRIKNLVKESDKRKSINELGEELNVNVDKLESVDEDGYSIVNTEEYNKLMDRNEEILKILKERGVPVETKPETEIIPFKKKPDEPEGKADGGRIGFGRGKRVLTEIDELIEKLNKKLSKKESMESMDPKTGELRIPKRAIKRAEEPTGTTVMDPEPEIIDEKAITKNKTKTAGKSINISDEATVKSFTDFAKENDPEGFKKIQKIVDDINNKNILEDFDVTGREPNANGGIAGLL